MRRSMWKLLSAITPASADLAPDGVQIFTATYEVSQDDIDAGTDLTNIATADGTPVRGTLMPVNDDAKVELQPADPNANLTKTASPDTAVNAGDIITYTYVLTNSGNVTLTNSSLTDIHSGTGSLSAITPASVPTLAPGDSVSFTATYVIRQSDIDVAAPITNTATLTTTPEGGTLPLIEADESVTVAKPDPQLIMEKAASDRTDVVAGQIITYSYKVENTGNVTMNAVSISDVHSGTGTLSAITPTSVTMAPGDTEVFTATYQVTQDDIDAGTDITNVATANATPTAGSYTPITDDETVLSRMYIRERARCHPSRQRVSQA